VPRITAVIDEAPAAALKERAKAEDRSVGAVVRRTLVEHVGRRVQQPALAERTDADR
jgi:hypothetical protein